MKEDVRRIQLAEKEILSEFDSVCKKAGLSYYLIAGTLLGAVRHGGFIPWDDDVDVGMPRKDFERLQKACREHLAQGYTLQSPDSEKDYPFFFYKIRKDGTELKEGYLKTVHMQQGVYIDIFPLDGCPATDFGGKLLFKWVQLLTSCRMAQVNAEHRCGYKKKLMRGIHCVLQRTPRAVIPFLWKSTVWVLNGLFHKKLCTVCGRHGYPAETYRTEWFDDRVQLPFEGDAFPAPAGWDAMLTNLYGDYMTLPPEAERERHFDR